MAHPRAVRWTTVRLETSGKVGKSHASLGTPSCVGQPTVVHTELAFTLIQMGNIDAVPSMGTGYFQWGQDKRVSVTRTCTWYSTSARIYVVLYIKLKL